MPDGAFNLHVVERLLKLPVSNEIANLGAAVETVTELDRLVLSGVFALFFDAFFRLVQPVVVKVHLVDVGTLEVVLVHGLNGDSMSLLIRFGAFRFPTLSVAVHEAAHLPFPLIGHG